MKRDAWRTAPLVQASEGLLPERSGVYAMLNISRSRKLPYQLEVIYVGQANNLRRRFREHINPRQQSNLDIFGFIKSELTHPEFWYLTVPESKLNEVERELIREIKPKANIILYGRGHNE